MRLRQYQRRQLKIQLLLLVVIAVVLPRITGASYSRVEACTPISFHRPVCAIELRGGYLPSSSHDNNDDYHDVSHDLSDDDDEDEENDDDNNDQSDDEPEEDRRNRRQGHDTRRSPMPSATIRRGERLPQRQMSRRPTRPTGQQQQGRRKQSQPRQPGVFSAATKLAKTTADLTTAAAWTTLKGSGKAAMYLLSPKHVKRSEIYGVWRLDQSITTDTTTIRSTSQRRRRGSDASSSSSSFCAANVEFTSRGDVLVRFEGRTTVTPYLFRERNPYWPQSSATIEFEAKAFQGPHDSSPQVLFRYKGYFQRKLADPSVIKIVGHIYTVQKLGWRRGDGQKIGSFVARRRLKKGQRQVTVVEEEYDDDWDDDNDDVDNAQEEDGFESDFNDDKGDEVDAAEFDEEEEFDRDDDDDY